MTAPSSQVMSPGQIRCHFPALERRHNGQPVAYFDGPGGTQVPRQVVEAMNDYLYRHNANTHWAFPTSHETDEGDYLTLHPPARTVVAAIPPASA
jgi:selenocysteine lyase/cysteine desulfurase